MEENAWEMEDTLFFWNKKHSRVDLTLIGSDKFFPLSSSTTLIAIDYGWSTYLHLKEHPPELAGRIQGLLTIGFP